MMELLNFAAQDCRTLVAVCRPGWVFYCCHTLASNCGEPPDMAALLPVGLYRRSSAPRHVPPAAGSQHQADTAASLPGGLEGHPTAATRLPPAAGSWSHVQDPRGESWCCPRTSRATLKVKSACQLDHKGCLPSALAQARVTEAVCYINTSASEWEHLCHHPESGVLPVKPVGQVRASLGALASKSWRVLGLVGRGLQCCLCTGPADDGNFV